MDTGHLDREREGQDASQRPVIPRRGEDRARGQAEGGGQLEQVVQVGAHLADEDGGPCGAEQIGADEPRRRIRNARREGEKRHGAQQ